MHLKHFIHSKTAKTSSTTVIIIAVVAVAFVYAYSQGYLDSILDSFSIGGTGGDGIPAGMVSVNKKIQFTWTAEWSGTAANAKTFYVYDENLALRETLTTAATGIVASAQNYPSGTLLYVKYDDNNNQVWYEITVPYMSEAEAQAQTYNDISLKYFVIGTYSAGDLLTANGLTWADAATYNLTTNSSTPIFTYTLSNTGNDNTGLMESYDPIYGQAWEVWVCGEITGNNASKVILSNVDVQFKVGNDIYFADKISANALSKWLIGTGYQPGYSGTDKVQFSMDLTGLTATSAATVQLYLYAFADPYYAMSHGGNWGQNKVELAETTLSIVDI